MAKTQRVRGRRSKAALGLAVGLVAWTWVGAAPPASDPSPRIDTAARHEVLQTLARELENHYVIPDTAKRLAEALREKDGSDAYRTVASGGALANALSNDLFAIAHDKHMRAEYVPGPPPKTESVGPNNRFTVELAETMRVLNGLVPQVEVLEGNVGYIRLGGLAPLSIARDPIAAAFAFVHRTAALIIDNRLDEGGTPDTVAFVMSYLSEGPPYVINTLNDRNKVVQEIRTIDLGTASYGAHKPVFVLTSSQTFSGGEWLTYDLQAFKRALVVGERTAGASNPSTGVSLGHHFFAGIPEQRIINPLTHSNWERVGIKPDIATPAIAALNQAYRLAVERLLATEKNPIRLALLEAVDANVETLIEAQSGEARLTNAQLTGTYAPVRGTGPKVIIAEKDGELRQHLGIDDNLLIRVSGNRFVQLGRPEGFFTSFLVRNGATQMVSEAPPGPPELRERR